MVSFWRHGACIDGSRIGGEGSRSYLQDERRESRSKPSRSQNGGRGDEEEDYEDP